MPRHRTPDKVGPQISRFRLQASCPYLVDHIGDGQVFWLWWCNAPSGFNFPIGHNVPTCAGAGSIRLFVPWSSVGVTHT